jgi:ABC-type transport system involved in multi-copper enzyme maturation permease subunit
MDKTLILFICGLGIGFFVGNLELPSDLNDLETIYGRTIVAGTEIWLIIHYVVALTTLPILAITYLKKRTNPPLRGLPLAFNAGFLCSSISMGLIHVLTQIVTT